MHLNFSKPSCDTLFTIATALLSSLSLLFLGSSSFSAFFVVVHQRCHAETDTCLQPYNEFHFCRIDTRANAIIHKAFAYKYLSNNVCTVVEEWRHSYFCFGYFFFSTHFDLVIRLAQKAWRQCVLVFVHDLGSRDGNCIGPLANTGLFSFHWFQIPFLLQRRLIPLDF